MLPTNDPRVRSKYFVFTAELVIPILIIILLSALWWIVFKSSVFTVKYLDCELDYAPCENESVQAELEKLRGQNILQLEESTVKARLTSGDFTIRELSLKKILPNHLRVQMQSVYPVSALHLRETDNWVVLDAQKRIIGIRHQSPNVPEVLVSSLPAVRVGQVIEDHALVAAIDSALQVSVELPTVTSVSVVGDTLELNLPESKKAILSLSQDLPSQIHILQVVLSDSTMMKGVRTVDVRFSQPVLK